MGFFSRKNDGENSENIHDNSLFADESAGGDKFKKIGDADINMSPYVITPEEITGRKNVGEGSGEETLSPLEVLRRKIMINAKEEAEKKEAEPAEESNFEVLPKPEEDEEPDSEEKETGKISFEVPHNEEEKAEEEFGDDTTGDIFSAFDSFSPVKDSEEKPDAKASSENEEEKPDESLIERCKPFILDGDDGFSFEKKPEYELESVEKILGLEEEKETEEAPEKTIVFDAVKDEEDIPDISDIDSDAKIKPQDTFTSQFDTVGATGQVPIAEELIGNTNSVPLPSGMKFKPDNGALFDEEEATDNDYVPKDDYNDFSDAKRIGRFLRTKRRNAFLRSVFSVIAFAVLLIIRFVFTGSAAEMSRPTNIAALVITLAAALISADVFASLGKVFSRRVSADSLVALTLLLSAISLIFGIFTNAEDTLELITVSCVSVFALMFRNVLRFKKLSVTCKSYRFIANKRTKNALYLITDETTAFTMSRHAIDSDIMVASTRRTNNVTDFVKHSFEDEDLGGKAKLLFFISLSAAAVLLIASVIFNGFSVYALLNASYVSAFFSLPTAIMGTVIPIVSAFGHTGRYGAAITGIETAKNIEMANAMSVDCCNLFPKGSVELCDMKVLSANALDETIAAAAAITQKIKSPLFPIFKQILDSGQNIEMPSQDSIKYDENLGITGWVNDERIYIGNRTLMEVRGIRVPSIETDRKILRDGYFPVYLARGEQACALLKVKYSVDPALAKEIGRISDLGITILVNNCDQNITEAMIRDYFSLYEDDATVKIMNGAGVHMYKTATNYTDSLSSGAVCGETLKGQSAVVYAANKIKKAIGVFFSSHWVFAVAGAVVFAYTVLRNIAAPASVSFNTGIILIYQAAVYLISRLLFSINKP